MQATGSPKMCRYCGDAPCEREQFGEGIAACRPGLLTQQGSYRREIKLDKALYQVYYYYKHGSLPKRPTYQMPVCVSKEIALLKTKSLARPIETPSAAAMTSSRADRTVCD
ncbi:hypothetical protein PC129_g8115 [Phytophthora cactorum]|uniref:Uncharacterized protein n=1 Tax=Phytophthora cactorum TaxID=29920 RepID=A0A329S1L6_9STRA|nr:hypothetical protein Pcac1_g28412 [Phytophthora cactorum]KAG2822864.1 hypothetical protein PC112_g10752 [Phytophthora cactorum]KAG2825332.1 hypothetical protein PC111_g9438 [Phytophthora cactorum]KAG2857628.1 hypothetical protein PC113_g10515 [Phytophthora cactorum]KAG2905777.1 hypothetical protein PC114_g11401 [Phytophthora cactorum]